MKDRIMMSLEQHDINFSRQTPGQNCNAIGFYIMKVEENRKYRVHIKPSKGDISFKSDYLASRSIFGTAMLTKGRYVLLPTTKDAGVDGKFMIRLYGAANSKELKEDSPTATCCGKPAVMVTTLTVQGAKGLEITAQSKVKTIDPYIKLLCEGEKVMSEKMSETSQPEWYSKATFYRTKRQEAIIVEIWNRNALIDDFMGAARIYSEAEENGEMMECDLFGRMKERDTKMPGNLNIHIRSSDDLAYL